MSFLLERNMTPIIQTNIKDLLSNIKISHSDNSLLMALELPVHYRMVDVAVALMDDNNLNKLYECHSLKQIRNLTSRDLDILSMIHAYQKASIHLLKNYLGIDVKEIRRILDKLTKLNLVIRFSKYTYVLSSWVNVLPKRLVSIELKLSKWQEALEQGIYNLKFSDFSFVALDEDQIPRNKNIESYFIDNNVGLIYVNSNGNMYSPFIPKQNNIIDAYMKSFQQIKLLKDIACNTNKWNIISRRD